MILVAAEWRTGTIHAVDQADMVSVCRRVSWGSPPALTADAALVKGRDVSCKSCVKRIANSRRPTVVKLLGPQVADREWTKAERREARALLAKLRQDWPAFRGILPLKIGVIEDAIARLPEVSPRVVRFALALWTQHDRYLAAQSVGGARYDLDGVQVGEVTDDQRSFATKMVKRSQSKKTDRWVEIAQRRLEKREAQA